MKLLYIFADSPEDYNTSEWRCAIPSRAINNTGFHQARMMPFTAIPDEASIQDIQWADIIAIERNLFIKPIHQFIKFWQARGKKIVANFDDAYQVMPLDVQTSLLWKRGLMQTDQQIPKDEIRGYIESHGQRFNLFKAEGHPLHIFRESLKMVDAYATPSDVLTQDFAHLNPHHYVLRNYPDYSHPEWKVPKKPPGEQIIIGWGGSSTHLQSFRDSDIIRALRKVLALHPNVRLMIVCNHPDLIQFLTSNLPRASIVHIGWRPLREWIRLIGDFDIGIAPLAGKYDDRRSWIKCVEFGARGVPWIASNRPPYKECKGGILVENDHKAWTRALMRLITEPEERVRLSEEGQRWAGHLGISEQIEEHLKVYREVLGE